MDQQLGRLRFPAGATAVAGTALVHVRYFDGSERGCLRRELTRDGEPPRPRPFACVRGGQPPQGHRDAGVGAREAGTG